MFIFLLVIDVLLCTVDNDRELHSDILCKGNNGIESGSIQFKCNFVEVSGI